MNELEKMITDLDSIHGVSGDEEYVADYITGKMSSITDEQYTDSFGNRIFVKNGTHPSLKVMIAAHMDEIGYIVNYIDDKGFIDFLPVGIHDARLSINQAVNINTIKGTVNGVIGNKPSHVVSEAEASMAIPFDELFIDVGTSTREETEQLGVAIGDYLSIDRKGRFLNNGKVYSGKSIDNRSGCAVMIQTMRELHQTELSPTIYAVATVQEEIGIRGAGPAAYAIKPDVAIVVDVTFAGGTPNISDRSIPIQMGKGPAIKFFDWSLHTFNGNAVSKKMTNQLMEVAKRNGIPFQREVIVHGATDGAKISLAGEGILTGAISIPMRYMHSAIGCVNMSDLKNSVSLLKEYLLTLDKL